MLELIRVNMKKIKVIGHWQRTYLAPDLAKAVEWSKTMIEMYPHANMEVTGVQFVKDEEE